MLRASSEAAGLDVNLEATVGNEPAKSGLDHGELLLAFTEAVVRATDEVDSYRKELLATIGPEATGHAVATITAFSGLVRVADGTGIPIDDGLAAVSTAIRESLALDDFGGAANSELADVTASPFETIDALFGDRR